VATLLDTGFAAYQTIDPVIVGDVSGNGIINVLDISILGTKLIGLPQTQIPPIPAGVTPLPASGPDPFVSLEQTLSAKPGQTVTVPVKLDTAAGLQSAEVRLAYDPAALEVVAIHKGTLTGAFEWLVRRDEPGILNIGVAGSKPLSGGTGSLVEVEFRVKPNATPGRQSIDLQWAELNEGALTLNPAPVPGADRTDAQLQIQSLRPISPALKAQAVKPGAGAEGLSHEPGPSTPTFEIKPVVLSGIGSTRTFGLDRSGDVERAGWMKDFVTDLAQSEDKQNPNAKIRVTLPASQSASKSLKLAGDREGGVRK
jgi:hypothetical protein